MRNMKKKENSTNPFDDNKIYENVINLYDNYQNHEIRWISLENHASH